MSDRPDIDDAINILQTGGFNITGGKYAPQHNEVSTTNNELKKAWLSIKAQSTDHAQEQMFIALINRHQNQLLDRLLEEVIGEDDKPQMIIMAIAGDGRGYRGAIKARNQLRATQREAINKLRSDNARLNT
jgi:hypothetical protein